MEPTMTMRTSNPGNDPTIWQEIQASVNAPGGWRSTTLWDLRAIIQRADPHVTEDVKWKKPSRPTGVPVWSHDGIICMGEALKAAVRLTFPKGALIKDPHGLFNARLDSRTVRAIDVHQDDSVNEAALTAVIAGAVRLNTWTLKPK
jgi:hypothetical protein